MNLCAICGKPVLLNESGPTIILCSLACVKEFLEKYTKKDEENNPTE